jgi:hypothetical protein
MKISILEKERAPSRFLVHKGLGYWCAQFDSSELSTFLADRRFRTVQLLEALLENRLRVSTRRTIGFFERREAAEMVAQIAVAGVQMEVFGASPTTEVVEHPVVQGSEEQFVSVAAAFAILPVHALAFLLPLHLFLSFLALEGASTNLDTMPRFNSKVSYYTIKVNSRVGTFNLEVQHFH